jgi:hypothetical protein
MFRTSRKAVGTGIVTTLALAAVASPAAIAQPMDHGVTDVRSAAIQDHRTPDAQDFAQGRQIVASTPIRVAAPERNTASSFDVGDAAIGAGGALTVVVVTLGATAVVVRRRQSAGDVSRPARIAG